MPQSLLKKEADKQSGRAVRPEARNEKGETHESNPLYLCSSDPGGNRPVGRSAGCCRWHPDGSPGKGCGPAAALIDINSATSRPTEDAARHWRCLRGCHHQGPSVREQDATEDQATSFPQRPTPKSRRRSSPPSQSPASSLGTRPGSDRDWSGSGLSVFCRQGNASPFSSDSPFSPCDSPWDPLR